MKCIKYIKTGNVDRVTNGDAETLVASGKAKYIPKTEWREYQDQRNR